MLDDHVYRQPPYRAGEDWLEMRLMSFGDISLEEFFEQVRDNLYENVYGVNL